VRSISTKNYSAALIFLSALASQAAKAGGEKFFDHYQNKNVIVITPENAIRYGIDYQVLNKLFSNYKATQPNENFKMVPNEEQGYIDFSSFDDVSVNIAFRYSPVEPNATGGGGTK
jgi:hypothetical protein